MPEESLCFRHDSLLVDFKVRETNLHQFEEVFLSWIIFATTRYLLKPQILFTKKICAKTILLSMLTFLSMFTFFLSMLTFFSLYVNFFSLHVDFFFLQEIRLRSGSSPRRPDGRPRLHVSGGTLPRPCIQRRKFSRGLSKSQPPKKWHYFSLTNCDCSPEEP